MSEQRESVTWHLFRTLVIWVLLASAAYTVVRIFWTVPEGTVGALLGLATGSATALVAIAIEGYLTIREVSPSAE